MRIRQGYMLNETENSRTVVPMNPAAGGFQGSIRLNASAAMLYRMLEMSKNSGVTFVMVTHEPELAECADRIVTILDGKVCSNVVQDEETKKKNRDALFADLEGNLDIGGEAAKEQKK